MNQIEPLCGKLTQLHQQSIQSLVYNLSGLRLFVRSLWRSSVADCVHIDGFREVRSNDKIITFCVILYLPIASSTATRRAHSHTKMFVRTRIELWRSFGGVTTGEVSNCVFGQHTHARLSNVRTRMDFRRASAIRGSAINSNAMTTSFPAWFVALFLGSLCRWSFSNPSIRIGLRQFVSHAA